MTTRFDTLVIPAFLEFMNPMRIIVFIPDQELLLSAYDIFLFSEI